MAEPAKRLREAADLGKRVDLKLPPPSKFFAKNIEASLGDVARSLAEHHSRTAEFLQPMCGAGE